MQPEQTRAVMTLALMAAFADGQKDDRERDHIRDMAQSLGSSAGGADLMKTYQDVLLGEYLSKTVALLTEYPLYVVVLAPSVETVTAREVARRKTGYSDTLTIQALDEGLRTDTPRIGLWIDSSAMTVAETVDEILARLEEARYDSQA